VKSWSQAFDKEPLTKDFFKRFDQALEAVKKDLETFQELKSAEAYTQAQLLLERLIFLYFLQNRGWLDQERRYMPDRLKEYLSKPEAFTYYTDFLDRLFWTLSSAPGDGGRLPGVPFLNGGLFDDDEFRQAETSRRTNPTLNVRNKTFQTVFSELLEAFNFTVTEDTPLNQEVAVDPEMLGKVFESIVLHAEAADPDAVAPDKRKATGSYYTPRIVVHFICREVLHQYLRGRLPGEEWSARLRALLDMDASDGLGEDARELLKRILTPAQAVQLSDMVAALKCCDPAVGSGAFPVGLLHELVNLRRLLTTAANGYVDPVRLEGSGWLHDTKAHILQNCLFGVDIQQQAIEICRLRLWLSLVVDYDLGLDPFAADKSRFGAAIQRISQLPNLEMNFHRGDSLHDHISGVPIVVLPDRASRHAEDLDAIRKLGQQLHQATRADRKRPLRLKILEKRLSLSRRILESEIRALRSQDSALDNLFGLAESAAKKRERLTREIGQLEGALGKVGDDQRQLERLENRIYDEQFYPKLRKLEGAAFDSPFNFSWTIDFPGIFSGGTDRSGFDIIVGNPPFVTARNPNKRELWRQRWPLVCYKKYSLVAPFFQLSFALLARSGQLGFIVSNAFTKREFGQPLVERFFPTVDIQNIVDCSGLMFPGHGTPTCIVFGCNQTPHPSSSIRIAAIKPGGGDLRTAPEDSPLWHALAAHHDDLGFADARLVIVDRSRSYLGKWPWNFDPGAEPTKEALERNGPHRLREYLATDVGFMFIIGRNDIFIATGDVIRRIGISLCILRPLIVGDEIRDYTFRGERLVIFPYQSETLKLVEFRKGSVAARYFDAFRHELSNRPTFSGTFADAGRAPYQYHQLPVERSKNPKSIAFPEIATHQHFAFDAEGRAFHQKSPIAKLPAGTGPYEHHLLLAVLNSSAALLWYKQVCFSKRESEEAQTDTYYEFAGGKVEQLPLPLSVTEALTGKRDLAADWLAEFSKACSEGGRRMGNLALKKLFEKVSEAYYSWNKSLPGYVAPDATLGPPFETGDHLRQAFNRCRLVRDRLQAEMVALQEEMDWLIYTMYGILPVDHPAVAQTLSGRAGGSGPCSPLPLDQAQRPFRLWEKAEGHYPKAVSIIPPDWPSERRALWTGRLSAISDNEHIRRIEQPVYKRRWDEQWKVGNRWCCGPAAYAAEFVDAFEWWLREKAEWWLENEANGGPVELDAFVAALWKDPRIQAGWPVAAEQQAFLEYEKAREKAEAEEDTPPPPPKPVADRASFARDFKRIIDDETVPENLPWAVPFDELEKKRKLKIPAKVKSIRGQLNVPRERFHLRGRTMYLWAGLQFRK
jgi:hypothetical protein